MSSRDRWRCSNRAACARHAVGHATSLRGVTNQTSRSRRRHSGSSRTGDEWNRNEPVDRRPRRAASALSGSERRAVRPTRSRDRDPSSVERFRNVVHVSTHRALRKYAEVHELTTHIGCDGRNRGTWTTDRRREPHVVDGDSATGVQTPHESIDRLFGHRMLTNAGSDNAGV